MTVYGMYREVPKQYYMKDGTYKEFIKFFQDELDCAREAVKMGVKYESIYIEPSSKQLRKERLGI